MIDNTERNAEIARRRQLGEWPTDIARAMGLSRNTVIGALNRAGLCRADTNRSEIISRTRRESPNVSRGEQHRFAKLTASEVSAIRDAYWRSPISQRQLGATYGVCKSTIYAILAERSWRPQVAAR